LRVPIANNLFYHLETVPSYHESSQIHTMGVPLIQTSAPGTGLLEDPIMATIPTVEADPPRIRIKIVPPGSKRRENGEAEGQGRPKSGSRIAPKRKGGEGTRVNGYESPKIDSREAPKSKSRNILKRKRGDDNGIENTEASKAKLHNDEPPKRKTRIVFKSKSLDANQLNGQQGPKSDSHDPLKKKTRIIFKKKNEGDDKLGNKATNSDANRDIPASTMREEDYPVIYGVPPSSVSKDAANQIYTDKCAPPHHTTAAPEAGRRRVRTWEENGRQMIRILTCNRPCACTPPRETAAPANPGGRRVWTWKEDGKQMIRIRVR
jgi:hypothetical protein